MDHYEIMMVWWLFDSIAIVTIYVMEFNKATQSTGLLSNRYHLRDLKKLEPLRTDAAPMKLYGKNMYFISTF